jgi:hypothetical protein
LVYRLIVDWGRFDDLNFGTLIVVVPMVLLLVDLHTS